MFFPQISPSFSSESSVLLKKKKFSQNIIYLNLDSLINNLFFLASLPCESLLPWTFSEFSIFLFSWIFATWVQTCLNLAHLEKKSKNINKQAKKTTWFQLAWQTLPICITPFIVKLSKELVIAINSSCSICSLWLLSTYSSFLFSPLVLKGVCWLYYFETHNFDLKMCFIFSYLINIFVTTKSWSKSWLSKKKKKSWLSISFTCLLIQSSPQLQSRYSYYHSHIINKENKELKLFSQGQETSKRGSRDSPVDSLASEAMLLH